MNYPKTPPKRFIEDLHDYKVRDDYRWLENGDSAAVKRWSNAQNKLTETVISKTTKEKLSKELKTNNRFLISHPPYPCNGYYFWLERKPSQDQEVLYVKKGANGKKRVLVDPNLSGKTEIVTLDYLVSSPNGRYLAFGLSKSGNELAELQVLDVKTAKTVEKVAKNAPWSSIAWSPDSSGFYYTKHPELGTVPKKDERFYQRVYYHQLATDPKTDRLIFGQGRNKEDRMELELSLDGQQLIISVSREWTKNQLYVYNASQKKLSGLVTSLKGQFGVVFTKDRAFLITNYKSPNSRILYAPANKLPSNFNGWRTLIPEKKEKLYWFYPSKNKLIVTYMINASTKALAFDFSGKKLGELPMPKYASLIGLSCNKNEEEFFYGYSSFTRPGITRHFNPKTNDYEIYHRTQSLLKAEDYMVKQEWFKSKDGTWVPMFIVHHKNLKLDGSNPTILYGYGGFDISLNPNFLRNMHSWLKRGGVYVIANIRGGGEFGKKWHTDAILKNKQRSYDDFIAAAEHLISRKYTSSDHLGIWGGSNGGLLVCAVAVQKPLLFKAVVSEVPLADMVRFPSLLIASRWMSEYGNPAKKSDLGFILKYSPYHNVNNRVNYPAFLITTAVNDSRVDPMHARKMAAILQNSNTKNPVLLFVDQATGHTGSLTMSRFYQDRARVLAFFTDQLGLKI